MPSNRINDFMQDSRGFFWLATEGAGLVRYDGFEFKTVELDRDGIKPLITLLKEDNRGNIWMTGTKTLIKYDGLNFRYYQMPALAERLVAIAINPSNEVFVADRNKVFRVTAADTLEQIRGKPEGRINDMAWYKRELWFATDSGLYSSADQKLKGTWLSMIYSGEELLAVGPDGVVSINSGKAERISSRDGEWISAGADQLVSLGVEGLNIYENGRQLNISETNGLPDENFEGCLVDRTGVIWLFSNNGLTKLQSMSIRLYAEEEGIDTKVYSVLIDDSGNYYAGAANGLSVINDSGVTNITNADFPFGVVLSLAEYNNKIWIGTERGLVSYDGQRFREVSLSGSSGDYIFALHGTGEALWVGTSTGIYRINNSQVQNMTERAGLPFANIFAITEGGDGSLWFGTYTQGFFRWMDGHFETIREMGGVRFDSLRFNTFTAVSKNELWAGTLSEGIFHLSDTGFKNIGIAELDFAEIRSMKVGDNNRLWLGSNKGISEVSVLPDGYSVRPLNGIRGFLDEGCSAQALVIKNGRLLAGTGEGLLSLSIGELEKDRELPMVALTDVELFYGEVTGLSEYAKSLMPYSLVPYGLELPHNLNFLSFTLAGLSGYHPEDLVYRYRIKSPNPWTLAGGRREAVYSNLKPGNYVFEAQVSRDGEHWSEGAVEFPFEIKSPIWQRWWFIALLILFIGGLTSLFIFDRVKRLNQRLRLENSLLEMERKALRLQMNPHFIFNALDSISSFIFKNDPKQAVRYLNNFAKLMRLTLESSMEHLHPVETEVSVLKNYLELEKLRFQGKFEYEIEVDEEIDYDVGIPPMLIQPHVENAILHGLKPKKEKGYLAIRFILQEELLICEVEDDGIGRKASKELPKRKDHRSMATQINRDRLRLLKISKSDEIDIEIIDKENPTGTKVIIKLPAESI